MHEVKSTTLLHQTKSVKFLLLQSKYFGWFLPRQSLISAHAMLVTTKWNSPIILPP